MSRSRFIPPGAYILPIRTHGKDILQSPDIVFKSVAVSRVFGISERQGYVSKAAPLCFKSQDVDGIAIDENPASGV